MQMVVPTPNSASLVTPTVNRRRYHPDYNTCETKLTDHAGCELSSLVKGRGCSLFCSIAFL